MTTAVILLAIVFTLIALAIYDLRHHPRCSCGARMDRHYDVEEDAEVFQCPRCGRCYLIK